MKSTERLLSEKLKTLSALEKARRDNLAQVDPTELGDEGDLASNNCTMNLTSTLVDCWERETDQVKHALHRLSEGRYGLCDDCGSKIPRARLAAMPHAAFCVSCQQEHEKQGPRSA